MSSPHSTHGMQDSKRPALPRSTCKRGPPGSPAASQIVLIGVNDLQNGRTAEQAAERLDWLLSWLSATWPSSDVILQALLPTTKVDVGPANEAWAALAAEHGVTFSTCGSDLDPTDPRQYEDSVHPSEAGYRRFLPCLAEEARELLAEDRCGLSGVPAPAPAPTPAPGPAVAAVGGGLGRPEGAEVLAAPEAAGRQSDV